MSRFNFFLFQKQRTVLFSRLVQACSLPLAPKVVLAFSVRILADAQRREKCSVHASGGLMKNSRL